MSDPDRLVAPDVPTLRWQRGKDGGGYRARMGRFIAHVSDIHRFGYREWRVWVSEDGGRENVPMKGEHSLLRQAKASAAAILGRLHSGQTRIPPARAK